MAIIVRGTLTDPVGESIPGGILRVKSLENNSRSLKGTQAKVISSGSGSYSFSLDNGIYQIEVNTTEEEYYICGAVKVEPSTKSYISVETLLEEFKYVHS